LIPIVRLCIWTAGDAAGGLYALCRTEKLLIWEYNGKYNVDFAREINVIYGVV